MLRHRGLEFVLMALLGTGPSWGSQSAPERVGGRPGSRTSLPSGAGAAPVRVELKIPALGPSLGGGASGVVLKAPAVAPQPTAGRIPSAPSVEFAPSVVPAPPVVPGSEVQSESPAPAILEAATASGGIESGPPAAPEALTEAGRIRFDQAPRLPGSDSPSAVEASGRSQWSEEAARPSQKNRARAGRSPSLWSKVAGLLRRPDIIPPWPAKPGDLVRVNGKTYRLGAKIGEGSSSVVYRVEGPRDLVLKLVYPDFRGDPLFGREAEALQVLGHTEIAHAKLAAASQDQLVIVKEFVNGVSLAEAMTKNELRTSHRAGIMELAARLVSIGYTADLVPGNLIWDPWRSQWVLIDGGGFGPAPAGGPVGQLLRDEIWPTDQDKAVFLSGLRGRLGPDSPAWGGVVRAAERMPRLERALEELARRDASRAPGPVPVFEPGRYDPSLTDEFVTGKELRKRLGYDPLAGHPRSMLHTDDPGKLNTKVFSVEPPGKPVRVVKIAQLDIIRKEVAVRRFIRRWFGRYFDTPRSLARAAGWDSMLVMERSRGGPSYARQVLSLEQRVAFGLLARTFGLGDVNEGNVLYPPDGLPMLIDFEVALSPIYPVVSRIPDEGIVREMPWVSRLRTNQIEDYLPAIAAWREFFLKESTQREARADLRAVGYSEAQAEGFQAVFKGNLTRLEWTLQADIEFANQFVRNAGRP